MSARVLIIFKNPKAENPAACYQGLGITADNTAEELREGRNAINEYGAGLRDSIPAPEVDGMTHEQVENWLMDNYYIGGDAGVNLPLVKIMEKLADKVIELERKVG